MIKLCRLREISTVQPGTRLKFSDSLFDFHLTAILIACSENGEHGEKLKLELSSVTRLCGSFLMVRVLPKETQFKWSSSPVLTRKVWCQICCYEISRGNYADIVCLPCFVHRELKAQVSLKRHCDNKTVFWTSALRLGQSKHLVASYIHKLVSRFWCSW